MRQFRRDVQAVFQDPFSVFNPFYKVDHVLTVPIQKFRLAGSKARRHEQMVSALETVGLRPDETLGQLPTPALRRAAATRHRRARADAPTDA